jgi:flagellar biogenesis protein FliO
MAHSILTALIALAALSAPALLAQEGSATGELVRSGDVPYADNNALRRTPPAELADAHLEDDARLSHSDDAPLSAEAPGTLSDGTPSDNPAPETFSIASAHDEPLPAKGSKPLPRQLKTRSRSSGKQSAADSVLSNPTESLITMGGSLCVVLTLFFGLAWLTRRGLPKGHGKLPGEVIEVLGKTPLVKGQELQLIRVGARLVLICVTPNGSETLTEIVDRTEVDRLSTICRTHSPSSMTAAFNQVLTGVGREPASGFTGSTRTSADRRGGRTHA